MSSKSLSAEDPFEASFSSESVRRVPQRDGVRSFFIALLLLVSLLTFITTMLVHYPQKVDAFLNSDNTVQSKQVVTSSK